MMRAAAEDALVSRNEDLVTRFRLNADSEEHYRVIFDSIDQGVCTIQVLFDARERPVDYVFLETNRAFERQTGLVDVVGKSMRSLAPAHEEHWFQIYGKVALTGESQRFEQRAEALERCYSVYAFRIGPPDAHRVALLFDDITARRRVDEALRDSEARFRFVADMAPVLIWQADPDNRGIWFNKPWLDFTGRRMEEELGFGWLEGIHQEDRERAAFTCQGHLARRDAFEMEFRMRRHDGEYRWILDRGAPLFEPETAIFLGYIGSCIDITDRRRAEEAMRESEARFRSIFEQANDFIFTADLEQRLTSCNPAVAAALGYTAEEIVGRSISEFIAPEQFARTSGMLAKKLREGGMTRYEVEVMARDGRVMTWEINSRLTFGKSGQPTGLHAIGRDVTETRKATEALREADRRKDEFLATLAHELRNPLAPIRQAVAIARSPSVSEAQLRWTLDVIDRQGRHMALLLDDLLDAARITAGKIELRREPVELAAIVDMAVETARPLVDARGHELALELPPEPVQLHGDAMRLAQVVANLLTNAAKYSERPGRIELRAGLESGEVVIRVRDQGIGIAPAMLPRVFEMFSQATSAIDRAEGGLGIGLALVKGLVELHGGRIEAHSDGIGKGSEFVVHLPGSVLAPRGKAKKVSPASTRRIPMRILLADDNPDSLQSLELLLRMDGHEVHAAQDGFAALKLAQTVRPQVMVLDIGMPKLNGYEVARRIRAEPWGSQIKLIALTGWGQQKDEEEAVVAGFDHHLTKPVDHDTIQAVLQS